MKVLSKVVCLLPSFAKVQLGFGLGRLFWFVVPKWRKNLAACQVKECLGVSSHQAWAIARKSVWKYGPMIVEVLCFPLLSKENIRAKVTVENESLLKELFDQGKGVLWATAHFGNWELQGAAAALYGYHVVSVAQRQHNKAMDRFINEYRTATGQHMVYRTSVLEIVRMMDKGYGIGILADQDGGKDGIIVDFFGRPTSCPKGAAALARMKGAPVVLALMISGDDGKHEILLNPPVYVEQTANREKDIRDATVVLMKSMEDEIRKRPEMWFWLHNRWKADRSLFKDMEFKD